VPCCIATRCGRRSGQHADLDRHRRNDIETINEHDDDQGDDDQDDDDQSNREPEEREADRQMSDREYSERPWGSYTVLDDEARDHKVKRIVVHPGHRLSYQRHSKRSEHWFIVSGTAVVTLDGVETELHPGASIDIPKEGAHRIANAGETDVVFIEVQHGTYFGEDDIERLDDDYGRVDSGVNSGQAVAK
jgi:mannose-6-phosphate isomerase-like protein (cupin superfamily)